MPLNHPMSNGAKRPRADDFYPKDSKRNKADGRGPEIGVSDNIIDDQEACFIIVCLYERLAD